MTTDFGGAIGKGESVNNNLLDGNYSTIDFETK
jgi:hypothetical protein